MFVWVGNWIINTALVSDVEIVPGGTVEKAVVFVYVGGRKIRLAGDQAEEFLGRIFPGDRPGEPPAWVGRST